MSRSEWDPIAVTEAARARRRVADKVIAAASVRVVRTMEPLEAGAAVPRNLPSVQRAAEGAGWDVATAALGDDAGTWHALLAKRSGHVLMVCWLDGRFDCAVRGAAGRLVGTLGFREVAGFLRGEIDG